jgi:hypothetical protein
MEKWLEGEGSGKLTIMIKIKQDLNFVIWQLTKQPTKEQSFMSTNTPKNSTSQPFFKPKMLIPI